ncbi:hypothetical protein SAMN05444362_10985 [Dysgonomonas macrotermitis]|uniref:Uncharacterized protein n=1 Tax=Dysgonomonas macrotermitis TaxID=1346286 RepID=A0A1M5DY33_9BACT|nr:hypothetical protein SAMN05444362_10985 [Dysgonomonas macrotermitis]
MEKDNNIPKFNFFRMFRGGFNSMVFENTVWGY